MSEMKVSGIFDDDDRKISDLNAKLESFEVETKAKIEKLENAVAVIVSHMNEKTQNTMAIFSKVKEICDSVLNQDEQVTEI